MGTRSAYTSASFLLMYWFVFHFSIGANGVGFDHAEQDDHIVQCSTKRYQPTWASLETRPIPVWYDRAKFGIFIHWGVFSVPSFGSPLFWKYWTSGAQNYVDFMKKNYPPDFTYGDFAAEFKAEFYDPDQWADLFKAAGAR